MTSFVKTFETLKDHWAVSAIGADDLSRAVQLVNEIFEEHAIGEQIPFLFLSNELLFLRNENDRVLLEQVALALDIAAIEGLDKIGHPSGDNAGLRDQAIAASFCVFDIMRLLPIPGELDDLLFWILQRSAVACCGNRWSDLHHWHSDYLEALRPFNMAKMTWDDRLLYDLFDCWIRLFRSDVRENLEKIGEIITNLRKDQKRFEEARLKNDSPAHNQAIAWRLASFYNWAKGTELVASYMLYGEPQNSFESINKHFDRAINSAAASGDRQYEMALRWLHAAARIMVTNPPWSVRRAMEPRIVEGRIRAG